MIKFSIKPKIFGVDKVNASRVDAVRHFKHPRGKGGI